MRSRQALLSAFKRSRSSRLIRRISVAMDSVVHLRAIWYGNTEISGSSPLPCHPFRSVSSVRSCDRFYHGKKFLTAQPSHTRSQIVGDNGALPPDWSQKFGTSPFRNSHILDRIREGPNSVRVTFSRRSPTKELQFHSVASSFGLEPCRKMACFLEAVQRRSPRPHSSSLRVESGMQASPGFWCSLSHVRHPRMLDRLGVLDFPFLEFSPRWRSGSDLSKMAPW